MALRERIRIALGKPPKVRTYVHPGVVRDMHLRMLNPQERFEAEMKEFLDGQTSSAILSIITLGPQDSGYDSECGHPALYHPAVAYVARDLRSFYGEHAFLHLSVEAVCAILESPESASSVSVCYRAAATWISAHRSRRDHLDVFGPLLRSLRSFTLSEALKLIPTRIATRKVPGSSSCWASVFRTPSCCTCAYLSFVGDILFRERKMGACGSHELSVGSSACILYKRRSTVLACFVFLCSARIAKKTPYNAPAVQYTTRLLGSTSDHLSSILPPGNWR
eukprot:IDg23943t1